MCKTEADTCRKYVLPKLYQPGWSDERINEQYTFPDGHIPPISERIRRGPQKRADYRPRFIGGFPIAIVEANASYRTTGEGLQQAKDCDEILGFRFAYATNDTEITEFDFLTGQERKAQSPSVWPMLGEIGTGTNMRQRRLRPSSFHSFKMPLPPMKTQQKHRAVNRNLIKHWDSSSNRSRNLMPYCRSSWTEFFGKSCCSRGQRSS